LRKKPRDILTVVGKISTCHTNMQSKSCGICLFIYLFIHLQHVGYGNQYSDQATNWTIGVRVPAE